MSTLFQDVKYAIRTLSNVPAFTAVAVLTLALGIGANTAIFSVVNAVLLRPLPFRHPSQLVDIWSRSTSFDFPRMGSSLPDLDDVRQQTTVFSEIAEYNWGHEMALRGQGNPQEVTAVELSQKFFPLLGLQPLYGRLFLPSEMHAGQDRVVILNDSLWRSQFGGDPHSIGKTITLDGKPYTIIGIMPPLSFLNFPTFADVWIPFVPDPKEMAARGNHFTDAVARLKPGRTLDQAQAELSTVSARLAKTYPDTDKEWSLHAQAVDHDVLGDTRTPLLILLGAVGFVLLIACANVGNLFLSRGLARRRELAIRSTLGATRGRLIRQLLVESILLALIGGACGLLLAVWGVQGLRTLLPPDTPRIQEFGIDHAVLWFTLGASALAGILFGLAPAILASRQELNAVIKEGAGAPASASGPRHGFLRRLLVAGEIALALILLISATLALRSLAYVLRLNLGFRSDHLLTMQIDTPAFQFANAGQQTQFVRQVLERVRALPGVTDAAITPFAPFSGWSGETTFRIEGVPENPNASQLKAEVNEPTPNYFRTLGIPLIAGREFTDADTENLPDVYVVNEALVKHYFGAENPIGRQITTGTWDQKTPVKWGEIVGVVANTRNQDAKVAPKPELYRPLLQENKNVWGFETLLVRTHGNPLTLAPLVKDQVWAVNKSLPITQVRTMDQGIAQTNAQPRFQALLLGIFGALGLLLAVVGIYGVISYSVTQRTHEIGIRMALGAAPTQVMRLILAHGLKLALLGVAIGIAAALALTRLMSSLLFGISATDPLTFAAVTVLLLAVAIAACYIPARRAMRVDPMVALRYE
ncbi:MAG TPA: ABC transporter permease [Candidatus Sulfotelmatobacter sp.]|nr:ABC transporter permease [Candidatus Sulfotelmatobacter sp.]